MLMMITHFMKKKCIPKEDVNSFGDYTALTVHVPLINFFQIRENREKLGLVLLTIIMAFISFFVLPNISTLSFVLWGDGCF